jgi:nucleotide-binding universal stress UspA family protein
MPVYHRILTPIDGSETAGCGIHEAIRLAKDQKAQLRFLYVVDAHVLMKYYGPPTVLQSDVIEVMRKTGEAALGRALAAAREQGVQADSAIVESSVGRVSKVIVEQAHDWPADLIVIGTHGRRGASRLVMGSDAEEVVRLSPVPVLLVRMREAPAVER